MKINKGISVTILIILIALLISCSIVSAHRVHISTRIGEISVKSWYGGGAPLKDANVTVYLQKGTGGGDGTEELYATGVTDENGEFGFPPKIGTDEYRIVVESTHLPGHGVETTINMDDFQSGEAQGDCQNTGGSEYGGIIAGFGYLAGLVGVSLMYASRKKQKALENKLKENA